jgi:hypothetical protein
LAPQPIKPALCTPPSTVPAPAQTLVFTGNYFSIAYPAGWQIAAAEANRGTYLDTQIVDPGNSDRAIRVDVTPRQDTHDPSAEARPQHEKLQTEPGYRELAYELTQFNGYPALYWEFVVPESGVLLHKVDVFFTDARGNDVAVLTEAPEGDWSRLAAGFAAIRASLTTP